MTNKEIISITKTQKEVLTGHLNDIQSRLDKIINETDYLAANCKAIKIILPTK